MFEQLRRKRMLIESSVSGKRGDREGMSSAERRRMVEKDLSQYNQMLNKTMQNFRKTQQLQQNSPPVNKTFDRPFREQPLATEERKPVLTPSVKDILPIDSSSALANEFYQLSAEPKTQPAEFSPNKNIANFYKKQPAAGVAEPEVTIHNMEEHQSHRESEPQIEDEDIKFPKIVNNSKTDSNNNSEAIFFTSHFKEIMNNNEALSPNQPSPPKPQQIVQPVELAENKSGEKEGTARFELKNNASGQSLALSNDSSLKYSLNESAIQDIITRKLSNELVVESVNPQRSITHLANALLIRQNIKDVVQFGKTFTLVQFVQRNTLRSVFQELMVNKEIKFMSKQSELKAASFLEQRADSLISNCFTQWIAIARAKQQRVGNFTSNRQRTTKEKCFKTMKMLLFDRRIIQQIDMYYLSKVFQAFRSGTEKQTKRSNQKAYKQYFKHLKRRMFGSFIEGCYNARRQNATVETAYNHYYYNMLRKHFDAWRNLTPRQQKFIRLSMTTKNQLKQTADHRLLQTKTFDFYEVK